MKREDLDMINNPWAFCGNDAVFLPGKIHESKDHVYILYFNECADNGNGCWEIEIIDRDRIIEIYEEVNGSEEEFFEMLPDYFHGEWYYCNRSNKEDFDSYAEQFVKADYIAGIDTEMNELEFLIKWPKG